MVDLPEDEVLPLQQVGQVPLQVVGVEKLARLQGLLLVLVRVEGGDALLGGAVLLVLQALFLQGVQLPVPGQQQGGPVADLQVLRGDGDAGSPNVLHLIVKVFAVQGHAVAQDVHHALPEDAGGQQVQGELALVVDDGVTGVAAALIANGDVIVAGEQVHHAALALVAPVDAYDRAVCHTILPPDARGT